ncbi:VanZ family protein [Winogradskyella sp.]|uniref:VanZ family protein n=1 Tax=Winogradskyella sp. TaxID=1883156 RepID=UPI0025F3BC36|nr:VanZ family protein [Winogradskyella sp.]
MLKNLLLPVAIVYTIVLVVATLINLNGIPSLGSSFDDKIYHLIAYFGLGFLWITYFKPRKKKNNLVIVFLCLILFGVVLELIQHQLNPNRTYDTYDLIANCLGVMLGTLIATRISIYKLK